MVCDTITNSVNPSYCVLEEESAQIPWWDVVVCGKAVHSIPQGNDESKRTSQGRCGRTQPIPRRTGHSCWFQDLHRELCSHGEHMCEHFHDARATELLWCQGHRTLAVPGAQVDHSATIMVLDPIRSDKSFIFLL